MNTMRDIKYPPKTAFLCYAFIVCIPLFHLAGRFGSVLERGLFGKCVVWISRRSFDIYLLHIVPVCCLEWLQKSAVFHAAILDAWPVRYAIYLGFAFLSVALTECRLRKAGSGNSS